MQLRFKESAQRNPQLELHIRAAARVEYRFVAEAMADAAQAGLARIGFVSDPEPVR